MICFSICSTIGFFFSKIQTAKLALRRLKTLRHPNILRYIDALEVRIKEMFIDSSLWSPCYNYIYLV